MKKTVPPANPFGVKIGAPAERALANAGITSFRQLATYSEAEIAALHGIGQKAIGMLKTALAAQHLSFK